MKSKSWETYLELQKQPWQDRKLYPGRGHTTLSLRMSSEDNLRKLDSLPEGGGLDPLKNFASGIHD